MDKKILQKYFTKGILLMRNLKKFRIDKSGKSEAFFLKKNYFSLDKKTIDKLQKYSLEKKKRCKNLSSFI